MFDPNVSGKTVDAKETYKHSGKTVDAKETCKHRAMFKRAQHKLGSFCSSASFKLFNDYQTHVFVVAQRLYLIKCT